MERPAESKVHFAPYRRQEAVIRKLLREGRYRNVTHFMRQAIDSYLERLGRPALAEQARQMAEDFEGAGRKKRPATERLQDASRASDESW